MNVEMNKLMQTLDDSAAFTHEMYMSYIRAGFTTDQALQIVIALLSQNVASYMQRGEGDASA